MTVLLSCKGGSKKAIITYHDHAMTKQVDVKRDTSSIDIHDPYETGKDIVRLNKAIHNIFKFPEVESINDQIDKTSKGTHGVSIIVHDEFNGDSSYYHFVVGDNSHDNRYVNIFNFLMDKKTGQIKVYDPTLDTIMSLQDWRKSRK